MRIVIGEHLPLLRRGICVVIEDANHELLGAVENGDKLAKITAAQIPDIVVMDFDLPVLGGEALIKRIKEITPGAGILVLSDNQSYSCLKLCIEAGAAGYIPRSASEEQLICSMESIYHGVATSDFTLVRQGIIDSKTAKNSQITCILKSHDLEVLQLAAKGMGNKAIARFLGVSERTVHSYFNSIFDKMDVNSRTEAIYRGLKNHWITVD